MGHLSVRSGVKRLWRRGSLTAIIFTVSLASCAKREEIRPAKREVRKEARAAVKPGAHSDYGELLKSKVVTREDLAALLVGKLSDTAAAGMKPRYYDSKTGITDIAVSRKRTDIEKAVKLGLLDVFPDGSFQPADTVQRVHFAMTVQKILNALGQGSVFTTERSPFRDVPETYYAYNAVLLAIQKGILLPRFQGVFAPFEPITGKEALRGVNRLRTLLRGE